MNRSIKFRAWNGKMYSNYADLYLGFDGRTYEDAKRVYDTPNKEVERIEGLILMQFTGLFDKNGKEIYEGDVLACDLKTFHFRGTLEFGWSRNDVYGLHWAYTPHGGAVGTEVTKADHISGRMEIIGNIYENSDLLV